MRKIQTLLALFAIGSCIGVGLFDAAAAQSKVSLAAESATPLTTEELFQLYSNRSWIWKDGGGLLPFKTAPIHFRDRPR